MRLIVEGWRFVAHSYSIVNQFQCLEFLNRPNLELFHRDLPYFDPSWKSVTNLFDVTREARLQQMPVAQPDQLADVTFRLGYPFCLQPGSSPLTGIFISCEFGLLKPGSIIDAPVDNAAIAAVLETENIVVITPSQWSKMGLVNSGFKPERIVVVPHGVEIQIYHPVSADERTQLRRELGWEDYFVFFHVGAMTDNKGISLLLKAFAALTERYPEARLVLKGTDDLYDCQVFLIDAVKVLSEAEATRTLERVIYMGQSLSFARMAQLYQAADAYVSPYMAEGFNLPVLEAIASGLPVICTQGGSTDDFTAPAFALGIESTIESVQIGSWIGKQLVPAYEHLVERMHQVIEDTTFVHQARTVGVNFVAARFTWKHVVDQLLAAFTSF